MRATARASPIESTAVVLLVGARFRGQASRSTATLMWTFEYFASNDLGLPLMPMMGMPMCMSIGTKRSSSSVCPELLMATTMSCEVTTPRSP